MPAYVVAKYGATQSKRLIPKGTADACKLLSVDMLGRAVVVKTHLMRLHVTPHAQVEM